MKNNNHPQNKITGKFPLLEENPFRVLSMREFETFLFLLKNEGIEQSILKILIDQEFNYTSQTKGYDHISILCKPQIKDINNPKKKIPNPKWFAEKKKLEENGKKVTRIYVRPIIKKKYQKYMLGTMNNIDEALNEIMSEYIEGIKDEDKIRKKFKAYTETIILALSKLISDPSSKDLTNERFQKRIYDTIWKYYRSEILKYEVFSK